MGEATFKNVAAADEKVQYEVTDHFAGEDGSKSFKVIKAKGLTISLFPANASAKEGAKSRLVYNAQVDLSDLDIGFRMVVKELTDSGELLAGSSAKLNHRRAVVTEYDKDSKTNYERMTIGNNTYRKIMALISAVHKA